MPIWTTCRPRSCVPRKSRAPPGRHHRRERRILFSEFAGTGGGPPGPAASRHAGRVLNRAAAARTTASRWRWRRRPGQRPLVAEDTVLIGKAGSDRAGFHGRAAARRVFASGRAAASREARAADGAMPRGNGYRRIVTGTPAAAEQICDSASGSCDRPACHSSAGRRSDNGTRRAPRPTALHGGLVVHHHGCCLRTPSSAHCRCGWSRHRHRAKPPSHRPGFRCCSAPGRSTQEIRFRS